MLNFGSRFPIYGPPAGFRLNSPRASSGRARFLLSRDVHVANGVRIGLIRIPSMSPPNIAIALQQLDQEIAFFTRTPMRWSWM